MAGEKSKVIKRVREREVERLARQALITPHGRQLDDLFERLYFHEIDGRDKVMQRLQLPLVAFLAIAGFVGTMLQNVRRDGTMSPVEVFFWMPLLVGILALAVAIGFFVVSLIGKKYKYLPLPAQWQEHRAKCIQHYEGYENKDEFVSASLQQHLVERYVECATWNGAVNENKMFYNFLLLRCLIIAAIATSIAFTVFYGAKLDKSLVKSVQHIEITNSAGMHKVEVVNPVPLKGTINVQPEAPATASSAASTRDPRGQAAPIHPTAATKSRSEPAAVSKHFVGGNREAARQEKG